jgi:hypothetical protein
LAKATREPRPRSIGRVVAVRRLRRRGKPGGSVIVRIGVPRKLRGGWDWGCPVEIRGLDPPHLRYVHGVDAVQALQLGLDYIAIRVATSIPQPYQFEPGDGGGFSDAVAKYLPLKTRRKLEGLSRQASSQRSKPQGRQARREQS